MMIDGMARSSDLATITRDSIKFEEGAVHYRYYFTKETKSPSEVSTSIAAYPADRLICTPTVLQKYLQRTTGLTGLTVTHWVEGKQVQRIPLLLYQYQTKSVYLALSSQRIANIVTSALKAIDVTGFTAHSIRGASSSKCKNLGAPSDSICIRARWASEATFLKHYFKKCVYANLQPNYHTASLEFLMRVDARRVNC
jgi:CRISPR/Cas system CMR-associated protein Cmr1 (group 7 of RAMP superfamily)